jgi:ankyrin repeat protein
LLTYARHVGITLLHYAAAKGDRATCELLLAAGANKHARNSLGDTPAQDAKRMGHADLVGLLSN